MKNRNLRGRKAGLVGAVVLSASFTLLPASDALAENSGQCGFSAGAVAGSVWVSGASGCLGFNNVGFESEGRTGGAQGDTAGRGEGGGFGY